MPCKNCGAENIGVGMLGHKCHCVREDGVRIAVGICCGRAIGAALLAEEDFHDGAPWAKPGDCTCPKEAYENTV